MNNKERKEERKAENKKRFSLIFFYFNFIYLLKTTEKIFYLREIENTDDTCPDGLFQISAMQFKHIIHQGDKFSALLIKFFPIGSENIPKVGGKKSRVIRG